MRTDESRSLSRSGNRCSDVMLDGSLAAPRLAFRRQIRNSSTSSALHADGRPRRGASSQDGVALRAAQRKKIAHVSGDGRPSQSSQVGGLGSVGRRKMVGSRTFLSRLAKARARTEMQVWRLRWRAMLACRHAVIHWISVARPNRIV